MKRLLPLFEKCLVALILFSFCVPLLYNQATPLYKRFAARVSKWTGQASAPTPRPKKHRRSAPELQPADWKKEIAKEYNESFLFRDELIRATNEAFYRFLDVSPAPVEGVTFGKEDVLLETRYLREFCFERPAAEALLPLVEKVRRFQDLCDRSGIKFALLLTPSKISIQPEYIPDEWLQRYDSRPRSYDLLLPLLDRYGIRYVDGHALTREAKRTTPAPIFAKGGTHWSYYGAMPTTNALIDCLARQGAHLSRLETTQPWVSYEPKGSDTDLLVYINLALPWYYPVTEFTIKPVPESYIFPRKLTFIGGSFTWQVAQEIEATRQYSEINVFFYYKLYKTTNASMVGRPGSKREPTGPVDFEHEVYNSESIVLELNETVIASQHHLDAFLDDAFAHLPQRLTRPETLAR